MKFAVATILLLPFAFALEPEYVIQIENELDNAIAEQLNEIFEEANNTETNGEWDGFDELGDEDIELDAENLTETSNENFDAFTNAQWDIVLPEYSVKKKKKPKRGKILQAIVLKKPFKMAIVAAHNLARSTTIPPSSNMRKMTWDNSLEKFATAYTRKCIYEHNPNPKHRRFKYVGENLFISMGLPYNKELLSHAVKAWDGEKTVYDYQTTTCQKGKICGHYTQVVWADSFKVGCGVTRCGNINVRGKNWKNAVLFGCNYGPGGNYRNEKPYKSGKRCHDCHSKDLCKGRLCTNSMRDRSFFNPKLAKWTPWSKWSPCSSTCGTGNKRRDRMCNTYVPADCRGFSSEVEFCLGKPCQNSNSVFKYQLVLNEGEKFNQMSLADLFSGKRNGNLYKRTGG